MVLGNIKKEVLNNVVELVADKSLIDNNDELSRETKLILKELECAVTQFVATTAPSTFVTKITNSSLGDNSSLRTEDITDGWKKLGRKWIKSIARTERQDISGNWSTTSLREDDMTNNEKGLQQRVSLNLIRTDKLADISDTDFVFADIAQAERVMKDLKLVAGEAFPMTYNSDFNMQTDESFSRIFFHGIAAPLMADQEALNDADLELGKFMIDMSFMKGLDHRDTDLFKRYGAKVYFDENQMVTAIYDCDAEELVKPGDKRWKEAKMQAKVSAFTITTVREHLAQSHFMVANEASREVVKTLHPEHPIRRLLAIFTYNTVSVNQNAFNQLVPERSLIHRAMPLTIKGMREVFDIALKESIVYEPFPDREIKNPALEELSEKGNFPYLKEGREYYEIARTMVREWLTEAGDEAEDKYALDFYEAMQKATEGQRYVLPDYNKENMIDLISTIVFTVTAYHELIGHVPDYTDLPNKAGLRLAKNPDNDQTQVDAQAFILMALITASTSIPAPQLMAEFPNYIGVGDGNEWERDVWTKFLANMGLQAKRVQEAERNRDFEFKYFDPSLFECSISV